MPLTPDGFPGQRLEEQGILFVSGSTPTQIGEMQFITGSGFQFLQDTGLIRLGNIADLFIAGQAVGDVVYFDGTQWARLPAGPSGSVLFSSGTTPRWIQTLKSSSVGLSVAPTTTSTSFITVPDMLMTASIQVPSVELQFFSTFNMVHGDYWQAAAFVDNVEVSGSRMTMAYNASSGSLVTNGSLPGAYGAINSIITNLSSGSHVFDVRWTVTTGTARAVGTQRQLSIREMF